MIFFHKQSEERTPRRFRLGCLGKTLVGIVIYLLFCMVLGYSFQHMFDTPETKLVDHSVFCFELKGTVVEQAPADDPFASLLSEMPNYNIEESVGLDDILSNIKLAAGSNQIKGIYLKGGELSVGQASAKAIRDALVEFKKSGKWIIAYSELYSQTNYYIATAADTIIMSPIGILSWNGLSAQKMYYTRLLEKLGIEVQILKVGTFKSAVEPFFRTSMSEADYEQTKRYVDGIWDCMKQGVSEGRGLSIEELDALADRYMMLQSAEDYVSAGLVDQLMYDGDMDSVLTALTGTKDYKCFSTKKLAHVKRAELQASDKIAIVYAEGEIVDDSSTGIGGKQMVKTLRKIEKDEQVKAVVLRVNSPGGSANASEYIHEAVKRIQRKGVPVVVSMGDMAASGGYYISCEADYIFAEPNTLTGSIGIFGMVPNIGALRDKVGIDIDGFGTNRFSNLELNAIQKGMSPEERQLMQRRIDAGYELFTRRCAEGRHLSQDSIKAIGEGRVWLGKDALALGLVDELGNIDSAIAKAAALANMTTYSFAHYPDKQDPMAELLKALDGTTDEEKMIARLRTLVEKPRVLMLADPAVIE